MEQTTLPPHYLLGKIPAGQKGYFLYDLSYYLPVEMAADTSAVIFGRPTQFNTVDRQVRLAWYLRGQPIGQPLVLHVRGDQRFVISRVITSISELHLVAQTHPLTCESNPQQLPSPSNPRVTCRQRWLAHQIGPTSQSNLAQDIAPGMT